MAGRLGALARLLVPGELGEGRAVPDQLIVKFRGEAARRAPQALREGFASALGAAQAAELDGLMGLVEEIADFLRGRRLAGAQDASWVRTANAPVYSAEHLGELRQFTSVLTLTFRVLR